MPHKNEHPLAKAFQYHKAATGELVCHRFKTGDGSVHHDLFLPLDTTPEQLQLERKRVQEVAKRTGQVIVYAGTLSAADAEEQAIRMVEITRIDFLSGGEVE